MFEEGPTRARERPRTARYGKIAITVSHGPDTGATLEAAGSVVRVGTAADNDLVLRDDSVSRYHCEIEPTDAGVRVRDVASTNGVQAGNLRIKDAFIGGDIDLGLGDTVLSVRWVGTVDKEQAGVERYGDLLGRSPRMRELFAQLGRIAPTDYTLLIEGETGVGKDVVAESVHHHGPRKDGPFVVLDCGAVSPHVIESEVFGHERGAFTGAVEARAGVFEQAGGGTLFIDEVGELPLELQPKLLRVLEKRELRRVGGSRTISVDVRVISATNKNLRAEIAAGRFREDLYYRLAAAHLRVPPLRDRLEDLELLVGHFLGLETPPRTTAELPAPVWEMFRSHRWPGNVRELRNAVQRLALTPERPLTGFYQRPDLSGADARLLPLPEARREASDAFERDYLKRLLAAADGKMARAAALAGVSRQMLQKLLKKHDVRD